MTNLMTQQQADVIRSVGEGAIVLWAMWVVDQNFPGRMTKAKELLPYLYPAYKDVRKLETQLNALCASGRMAQTTAGYVLLEGGRALFLGMTNQDLALSPALEAGTDENEAQALEVVKNFDQNSAQNARALVGVVNTTKDLINNDLTTPINKGAQNARGLSLQEKILEESHLLFDGDFVNQKGLTLERLSASYLLSVLAYCYAFKKTTDRPSGFHSPAGMAHTMISQNKSPRKQFLGDPQSHLPDEYLLAVGLLKLECSECGEVFEDFENLKKHRELMMRCEFFVDCDARFHDADKLEAHHAEHREKATVENEIPSLLSYQKLESENRGAKAWKLLKDELQADMPRASFDTWVRDAEAVALENLVLTVAVRNAYARDWLESRLLHKVNVMLKKFTQENMTVKFVVGSVEGDDEL